jgi:hypothetical protein
VSAAWHVARGRGARWGVVVLWVLGAVLSYSALRFLALMVGFPDALADVWPLVIDVAVWVSAMNALEAAGDRRPALARYAWVLGAIYAAATVAGNALVAGTEPVDPRLVRALGDGWAHDVSVIAHAVPAVTMVLFAHLAGLLMGGRDGHGLAAPVAIEVATPMATGGAAVATASGQNLAEWPPLGGQPDGQPLATSVASPVATERPADGHETGQDLAVAMATGWPHDGRGHGHTLATERPHVGQDDGHSDGQILAMPAATERPPSGHPVAMAMTTEEARQKVMQMVRRGTAAGREVTAEDVARATGRASRSARRLLADARAELGQSPSGAALRGR